LKACVGTIHCSCVAPCDPLGCHPATKYGPNIPTGKAPRRLLHQLSRPAGSRRAGMRVLCAWLHRVRAVASPVPCSCGAASDTHRARVIRTVQSFYHEPTAGWYRHSLHVAQVVLVMHSWTCRTALPWAAVMSLHFDVLPALRQALAWHLCHLLSTSKRTLWRSLQPDVVQAGAGLRRSTGPDSQQQYASTSLHKSRLKCLTSMLCGHLADVTSPASPVTAGAQHGACSLWVAPIMAQCQLLNGSALQHSCGMAPACKCALRHCFLQHLLLLLAARV
jgi:hypothetical protein